MKKLSPNLMVKDVKETIGFYKNNLGFKLVMAVPETQDGILTEIPEDKKIVYALVKNGNVELMFQAEESLKEDITIFANSIIGASVSFEFGSGAYMNDPHKILEGTGKFRRHLKIRSLTDIEDKKVDFFVKQSL